MPVSPSCRQFITPDRPTVLIRTRTHTHTNSISSRSVPWFNGPIIEKLQERAESAESAELKVAAETKLVEKATTAFEGLLSLTQRLLKVDEGTLSPEHGSEDQQVEVVAEAALVKLVLK